MAGKMSGACANAIESTNPAKTACSSASERTPGVAALFERARSLGRSIGLELGEGSTGGGSDGNFTTAIGLPTLDGLGCRGAGAHADHEQIELDSLPERAALLAILLMDL